MRTPLTILALQVSFLLLLFVGCGPSRQTRTLGHIDLSVKGATCTNIVKWNTHYPQIELKLSDNEGAAKKSGTNPDCRSLSKLMPSNHSVAR
jgi:hypothetical protein